MLPSGIAHGAVLRAELSCEFLDVGPASVVEIAEARQQGCDFAEIRRPVCFDKVVRFRAQASGRRVEVVNLRRGAVVYRDGTIVARAALPGDPRGFRLVALGAQRLFTAWGLNPQRFRGTDYDLGLTTTKREGRRNRYLLSERVLSANLLASLPKRGTHKNAGGTLANQGLVGINGDQNWLRHHRLPALSGGGGDFSKLRLADRLRSLLLDRIRCARPCQPHERWVGRVERVHDEARAW